MTDKDNSGHNSSPRSRHNDLAVKSSLLAASFALTIVLSEIGLRTLAPAQYTAIGNSYSDNARFYGWGFEPGEKIILHDPDSGQAIVDKVNNHGWRDVDHEYSKPEHVFRILILGDSNTFAPLVSSQQAYSRLLEAQLRADGYHVEVISIAYGGWGTDQELEALKREGIRYRPDLIFVQFCTNDLADNLYWTHADFKGYKPFIYRLQNGTLMRSDNEAFQLRASAPFEDKIKSLASHSEILKRAYIVYRLLNAQRPSSDGRGLVVTLSKLQQMKFILGLKPNDPLAVYLSQRLDQPLDRGELERQITASRLSEQADAILRIAENQPATRNWGGTPSANASSDEWKLLFALLGEMKRVSTETGADFSLISDNEEGLYDWEKSWYRVGSDRASRDAFLAPSKLLSDWAQQNHSGFVESIHKVQRARNDPHPDAAGNQAMAENIYDFLMSRYKERLERFR